MKDIEIWLRGFEKEVSAVLSKYSPYEASVQGLSDEEATMIAPYLEYFWLGQDKLKNEVLQIPHCGASCPMCDRCDESREINKELINQILGK